MDVTFGRLLLDRYKLCQRDLTLVGSTAEERHVFRDLARYLGRGEVSPLPAAANLLAGLHEAKTAFIAKKNTGNIMVEP